MDDNDEKNSSMIKTILHINLNRKEKNSWNICEYCACDFRDSKFLEIPRVTFKKILLSDYTALYANT